MDDAILVLAAQAGDRDAFLALVRRYEAALLASARQMTRSREDAEDVAAEAVLQAFRHLGTLREASKFRGWLFAILRRAAIDHRRRQHTPEIPLEACAELPAPEAEPAYYAELLTRLPLPCREVLIARYFYDLSYDEMATAFHSNAPTMRMRSLRARKQLRELAEREEAETRRVLRGAMSALAAGFPGHAFMNRLTEEITHMPHVQVLHPAGPMPGIPAGLLPAQLTALKVAGGVIAMLALATLSIPLLPKITHHGGKVVPTAVSGNANLLPPGHPGAGEIMAAVPVANAVTMSNHGAAPTTTVPAPENMAADVPRQEKLLTLQDCLALALKNQRIPSAVHHVGIAAKTLERKNQTIAYTITENWFTMQCNEKLIEINEALVTNLREQLKLMQARSNAGLATPSDELPIQTALDSARLALLNAQMHMRIAAVTLQEMMGLPAQSDWHVQDFTPPVNAKIDSIDVYTRTALHSRANIDTPAVIQADIRDAYNALNTAHELMAAGELDVVTAEQNDDLLTAQVKQGLRTELDLMHGQKQLMIAKREVILARYDYYCAVAELDYAMGSPPGSFKF